MGDQVAFWTAFGAIGQAIGAIATSAAVIVTLWQIRYANEKKIKLSFSDNSCVFGNDGLERHFVQLSVVNIGNRNVVIQGWGIEIAKIKTIWILPEIEDFLFNRIQKPLPYTLEPEDMLELVYDIEKFVDNLEKLINDGTLNKNQKLYLFVVDSAGKRYRIKSHKTVHEYIEDNQRYCKKSKSLAIIS